MGETGKVLGIAQMAYVHVHRCTRFFRLGVMDKKGFELVVKEPDESIGTVVKLWLFDMRGQNVDTRGCICPILKGNMLSGAWSHGGGGSGETRRGETSVGGVGATRLLKRG